MADTHVFFSLHELLEFDIVRRKNARQTNVDEESHFLQVNSQIMVTLFCFCIFCFNLFLLR